MTPENARWCRSSAPSPSGLRMARQATEGTNGSSLGAMPRGRGRASDRAAVGRRRSVTAPLASSTSSSALRKVLTFRRPSLATRTSRRSRSRVSVRTGSPFAAGSETSSPPAQATCRRSAAGSWSRPRGAAQTGRRALTAQHAGSRVTRSPPRRSTAWTRPARSSTSRPGSSPARSTTSAASRSSARSTTQMRSRSGSLATAVRPSRSTRSVPPLSDGGGVG